MKNKLFLAGTLGVLLIFGMIVTGCKDDKGDSNPFKGTNWEGTAVENGVTKHLTISFTNAFWEFEITIDENVENHSGTYTNKGAIATLTQPDVELTSTATISGNTLTLDNYTLTRKN